MGRPKRTPHTSREPRKRANSVEERLFRVALRAFAEQAYGEVSVDALVQQAGTTKPMLYYYYGNKAGLYRSVAREAFGRLHAFEEAADDPKAPPLDRLRAFVRAELRALHDHPNLARFLYRTAYAQSTKTPPIDHWALFKPSLDRVVRIVDSAQRAGLIEGGPPGPLALPLFGLIGIWTQVHLAGPFGVLLSDEEADRVVQLYLYGTTHGYKVKG